MAEQTQELMFEILRKLQADITMIKDGQRDTRQDIALASQLHASPARRFQQYARNDDAGS